MNDPLFHCDLIQQSIQHKIFLQQMHLLQIPLNRLSQKSVDRYLNYWLPLVASVNNPNQSENPVQLIPPPNVAWLWHCHRLAPARYESYVRGRFEGKLLEANPPFAFQVREDHAAQIDPKAGGPAAITILFWKNLYPNEPFFLQLKKKKNGDPSVQEINDLESGWVDGFDLLGSAERQATLLWQISGPRFDDDDFLNEAVVNYRRFLKLKLPPTASGGPLPMVPTFQIDLMWHTHILVSIARYNADCVAIRGSKLYHDDSLDDRSPGALLDRAYQETQKVWRETYGQDYAVLGAMYRGEPPSSYYDGSWDPISGNVASLTVTSTRATPVVELEAEPYHDNDERKPWLNPKKDKGVFIPAQPRSTERGVNNNPQMDGYVFGKESAGIGYYSLETREAYKMLQIRLQKREAMERSQIESFDCSNCLCFGGGLSAPQAKARQSMMNSYDKTLDMLAYVRARANAKGPYSTISPKVLAKYRPVSHLTSWDTAKGPTARSDTSEFSTTNGVGALSTPTPVVFVYATSDICTAGGCGGGGCGGAGCGGAACGAGGGGGCGGGDSGGGGGGCGGGGGD